MTWVERKMPKEKKKARKRSFHHGDGGARRRACGCLEKEGVCSRSHESIAHGTTWAGRTEERGGSMFYGRGRRGDASGEIRNERWVLVEKRSGIARSKGRLTKSEEGGWRGVPTNGLVMHA
jgi:hypothetical protein